MGALSTIHTQRNMVIIDGYNLIHADEHLKSTSLYSLEKAREELMDMLSNYVRLNLIKAKTHLYSGAFFAYHQAYFIFFVHSASLNPTSTKSAPMSIGRFTSIPSVERSFSISSSVIVGSLFLRSSDL